MNIIATAMSLTVDDVAASSAFFTTHLGFREVLADQGFVSLARDDATGGRQHHRAAARGSLG